MQPCKEVKEARGVPQSTPCRNPLITLPEYCLLPTPASPYDWPGPCGHRVTLKQRCDMMMLSANAVVARF